MRSADSENRGFLAGPSNLSTDSGQVTLTWPPPFTVKPHLRAKHVKLKASLQKGLELIVPRRFNQKHIPDILEANRTWIEKQFQKLQLQRKFKDELPRELVLLGSNQQWQIAYVASSLNFKITLRPHQQLVLLGNIDDKQNCQKVLTHWVKKYAKTYLLNQLESVSREINLPYLSASIRNQASRWGSCSSKKMINLNYKLIFLPYELLRHVLIHELCHTVHLNHSEKFWRLVEKFDTHYKLHKSALRTADNYIPQWLV